MQIEIQFTPIPEGVFFFFTPGQKSDNEFMASFLMDSARELGFREGVPMEDQNPEAVIAFMRGAQHQGLGANDDLRRAVAEERREIRTAVFECREPNALDRMAIDLHLNQGMKWESLCGIAQELLEPRLVSGWEGEPSPDLLTCVKWEAYIRIHTWGIRPQTAAA